MLAVSPCKTHRSHDKLLHSLVESTWSINHIWKCVVVWTRACAQAHTQCSCSIPLHYSSIHVHFSWSGRAPATIVDEIVKMHWTDDGLFSIFLPFPSNFIWFELSECDVHSAMRIVQMQKFISKWLHHPRTWNYNKWTFMGKIETLICTWLMQGIALKNGVFRWNSIYWLAIASGRRSLARVYRNLDDNFTFCYSIQDKDKRKWNNLHLLCFVFWARDKFNTVSFLKIRFDPTSRRMLWKEKNKKRYGVYINFPYIGVWY